MKNEEDDKCCCVVARNKIKLLNNDENKLPTKKIRSKNENWVNSNWVVGLFK